MSERSFSRLECFPPFSSDSSFYRSTCIEDRKSVFNFPFFMRVCEYMVYTFCECDSPIGYSGAVTDVNLFCWPCYIVYKLSDIPRSKGYNPFLSLCIYQQPDFSSSRWFFFPHILPNIFNSWHNTCQRNEQEKIMVKSFTVWLLTLLTPQKKKKKKSNKAYFTSQLYHKLFKIL